ncbi:BfmA/BtgA family mobilization protein [Flavobacterium okayamense]|uniref:Uncharacterized protein n=1 Tax=Flavobacterium okayamense TaxID=2830782 RepID=A0ABM7S8I3_9FLAO|nr:BfmA/BtgA family mobilization protein [Flavobacterium okayamense]BCY28972.1 hypothetical protein KK2020170_18400 [Flavobacterium okayamense]
MNTEKKNIDIRLNGLMVSRWTNLKKRFGYNTNIKLVEDILYFFETNPVNPKDKFTSVLDKVLSKMDEFNNDNNRVIAVVRKIENDKLNPIFRTVTQDLNHKIDDIKQYVYEGINSSQNVTSIEPKTNEKEIENVIKKYEEKLKTQDKLYNLSEKINDDNHKKISSICKNLNEIKNKYSVEKGTFSKPKIVLELSEEEFLKLIKY